MTWASTCPAAIAGILAAFQASPDLEGVLVTDGPGIGDADATAVISVGFDGSGDPAAEASLATEGTAGDPNRERYPVRCAAGVSSGDDGDLPAARDRAFALLAACGAALAADRRLGGTVMSARLTSWSLEQSQTSSGPYVTLRFEVSIDAYTQR